MSIDASLQFAVAELKSELTQFDGFSEDTQARDAISNAALTGLSDKEKYWL